MRSAAVAFGLAAVAVASAADVAIACSRPPGFDHSADEERALREADTVALAEVVAVTEGGLDYGGSVWVRRTDILYGSTAPLIVKLGDGYGAQCARSYFMADNEVRVGDKLLVIGSASGRGPLALAETFFIDEASPAAQRLLSRWRELHPAAKPRRWR